MLSLWRKVASFSALSTFIVFAGCGGPSAPTASGSTYNNLNPNTLPPGVSVPSNAAISRNAQADSGWGICVGTCANAAVPQTYSMTQNISSPSLNDDDTATAFMESGTPYGDVLWHYPFGNSSATNFVIDLYLNIDRPENVQALEFAVLKNDGLNWYKTSTQCNYQSGNLRGFDVQTFQWVDLGAQCVPAQAGTWQRVTLQYSITGGTTNFEGVSFDGVPQPIAVSLPAEPQTTASELLGIHIQLDNANTTAGYTVFVDDWSVYSW